MHCVYNSTASSFSEDLDMWRSRNLDTYLDRMTGSEVVMSYKYYVSGEEKDNWALIIQQSR